MKYSRVILPIYELLLFVSNHAVAFSSDMNDPSPGRIRSAEFDSHSTAINRNLGVLCGDWAKNRWPIKGESNFHFLGGAVATSEDGLTIAIGSSQGEGKNEPTRSYVKVYSQRFSTGYASQLGNTITGVPSAGRDVSLSSDGMIIAIANVANENSDKVSGEVNVYKYHKGSDSWAKLGDRIIVDGSFFQTRASIELSGDGKVLVFGASGSGFDVYGKTRVFGYDDTKGEWVRKGRNIPENGNGNFASIEVNTSISKDGNIIAIGSSRKDVDGSFPSRVRVFRYNLDNDDWERMGSDLFGATRGDLFGASVSLGHDGSSLAVGSDGANNNMGNVKIFKYTHESDWTQIGQAISGQEENTYFGRAMAFSTSNRNMAVVVGSFSGTQVFQYKTGINTWELVGKTIDVGSGIHMVGATVAISGDAQRIVIGLPMNSSSGRSAGLVQTYELNKGTCAPTTSPTSQPTKSARPSNNPTSQPTLSSSPSSLPSISPSNAPSLSLAPSLSTFPSIHPTKVPTASPSLKPTDLPSSVPTDFPTTLPSVKPSLGPSASPSFVPSMTPTLQPTSWPSSSPSSGPSAAPSWIPSSHPTSQPTEEPTNVPSPSPTVTPTRFPSISPRPTPTLSSTPSSSPTSRAFARLSKTNHVVEVNEEYSTSSARKENAQWTIIFGTAITMLLVML